jgi:hypothetical protein
MEVTVIPGDKLLVRLWETIADKGIGSLLRPWPTLREDQAALEVRRQELSSLQQALAANHAESAPSATGDSAQGASRSDIAAIAARNLQTEGVRREIALASTVAHAEQTLLSDESELSTLAVADNWLLRWRDCVASVSSEELYSLWGRVLAAEVKTPGQFTLRGLEFIRNLTPEEARAIDKLSPFSVENFIPQGSKVLDAAGVTLEVLNEMQNIGVLTGVQPSPMTAKIRSIGTDRFYCALRCPGNTMLAVTADDPTKLCIVTVYFVSGIGRQIMNLRVSQPNEEMLAVLTAEIKQQGFKVQRGKFKLVRPGTAQFYDLTDL